jgi:hypothetical protein
MKTINLFYRRIDINQVQNLQNTPLFSSKEFKDNVGTGFANVTLYESHSINFDIEDCTFFLKEGALFFKLTLSNLSDQNFLKPGTKVVSQILGGNGEYLNAKGTVTITTDTDENAVRSVIIETTYTENGTQPTILEP